MMMVTFVPAGTTVLAFTDCERTRFLRAVLVNLARRFFFVLPSLQPAISSAFLAADLVLPLRAGTLQVAAGLPCPLMPASASGGPILIILATEGTPLELTANSM